jgi:hypothetical protein
LPDAVLLVDANGLIVDANATTLRLFDYGRDELIGRPVDMLVPAEHRAAHAGQRENFFRSPHKRPMGAVRGLRGQRRDGTEIPVDVMLGSVRTSAGMLALAVVRDIRQRVEAEDRERKLGAEIERAKREWVATVDALPMLVCLTDATGRIVRVNKVIERWGLCNVRDAFGQDLMRLLQGDAPSTDTAEEQWRAALAGAKHGVPSELVVERSQKERRLRVGVRAAPPGIGSEASVVVFIEDVTERYRVEEARRVLEGQLAHAQRLDSLGKLAGGLAHDLNNVLSAVLVSTDLLSSDLPEGSAELELVADIRNAADRAGGLARQLLAFGRRQFFQPTLFDLNATLEEQARMLARLLPEDVTMTLHTCAETATLRADRSQVEQVVLNLVVNARDAMPRGGGEIVVETAIVATDEIPADTLPHGESLGEASHWVRLCVRDSGLGMTEDVRARLFEPFFTTKAQGTGLGLSTAFGIVCQSGGRIRVESTLGQGATFEVFFPMSRVAGRASPEGALAPAAEAPAGATILLVEDEAATLRLLTRVLEQSGYRVIAAGSAEEARAAASRHEGTIDLLLTDVVMPGESGPSLAAALAKSRPDMVIVFMSGHTGSETLRRGLCNEHRFLPKPFDSATLLTRLHEAFASRHAA